MLLSWLKELISDHMGFFILNELRSLYESAINTIDPQIPLD